VTMVAPETFAEFGSDSPPGSVLGRSLVPTPTHITQCGPTSPGSDGRVENIPRGGDVGEVTG